VLRTTMENSTRESMIMGKLKTTQGSKTLGNRLLVRDIIIVRYYDHILFKDVFSSSSLRPIVREAVGWLDYENKEYIRIVWERYADPMIGDESRLRTTGLAIRKADVVEIRRLSSP